ncbi:MAG: exopolysaccharide biosynthesis protein [Fimbriimonadaceae bacterium]|nr:exopolysaccharide biosynthesis protein [Fimbriimonadaceae bacterium]
MDHRLSAQMRAAFADPSGELTFGDLLERVDTKSYGLLLALGALPLTPPTPPFFSWPSCIFLIVVASQLLVGRHVPWLPKWILKRKIVSEGKVGKVWGAVPKGLEKFEKLMKPRNSWVYKGIGPKLFAITIILASLLMLIPAPGFHSIPSFGMVLISLGYLEEDGNLGLLGGLIDLGFVLLVVGGFIAVKYFGYQGLKFLHLDNLHLPWSFLSLIGV